MEFPMKVQPHSHTSHTLSGQRCRVSWGCEDWEPASLAMAGEWTEAREMKLVKPRLHCYSTYIAMAKQRNNKHQLSTGNVAKGKTASLPMLVFMSLCSSSGCRRWLLKGHVWLARADVGMRGVHPTITCVTPPTQAHFTTHTLECFLIEEKPYYDFK